MVNYVFRNICKRLNECLPDPEIPLFLSTVEKRSTKINQCNFKQSSKIESPYVYHVEAYIRYVCLEMTRLASYIWRY